jgi:hypothetical protein
MHDFVRFSTYSFHFMPFCFVSLYDSCASVFQIKWQTFKYRCVHENLTSLGMAHSFQCPLLRLHILNTLERTCFLMHNYFRTDPHNTVIAYNILTKWTVLIVIISEKFVAERLSSVNSVETRSWRPQIKRQSWCGNSCDTMADNTGNGPVLTRDIYGCSMW